jgi:hypothetical protein
VLAKATVSGDLRGLTRLIPAPALKLAPETALPHEEQKLLVAGFSFPHDAQNGMAIPFSCFPKID